MLDDGWEIIELAIHLASHFSTQNAAQYTLMVQREESWKTIPKRRQYIYFSGQGSSEELHKATRAVFIQLTEAVWCFLHRHLFIPDHDKYIATTIVCAPEMYGDRRAEYHDFKLKGSHLMDWSSLRADLQKGASRFRKCWSTTTIISTDFYPKIWQGFDHLNNSKYARVWQELRASFSSWI